MLLLNNFSGDFGDPGSVGTGQNADGGNKTVAVWATSFGTGGTVVVEGSPDGGTTWIILSINGTPVSYTANEIRKIDRLGQGMMIRAAVSAGTGIVGLNVAIFS